MENNILLDFLIGIFGNYPILISFFSGLFGGELTIIALSFIAESGYMSLWNIIVFTTLGLNISDLIIFLIGRAHYVSNLKQIEFFSPHFKKVDKFIIKWSKNNLFLVIFYAKFIYGVSIPTLIYLGMKKIKIHIFLIYTFLINLIFVIIFMVIGIIGAKGFALVVDYYKNIHLTISFLILFIVLLVVIKKWLNIKLIKGQKK
ncbi:MAG: hypothetical protein QXI33_01960 [Candidatus Pacearchaeota archaeon]